MTIKFASVDEGMIVCLTKYDNV